MIQQKYKNKPVLKMEIALERELLEEQGYDWYTSYNILCKNF